VALGGGLEQHTQHVAHRIDIARRGGIGGNGRQRGRVPLEAALDGVDDLFGALRAREAIAQRTQLGELLGLRRHLVGDVVERLVADDAAPGYILSLGRALAPGGKLDEYGQGFAAADLELEAAPGILGQCLVGAGIEQRRHFLVEPVRAPRVLEHFLQARVDLTEVRHISERVVKLLLAERPAAPVRETRGFVEILAADALDEIDVADAVAEAAHHGGHLRVEHRRGQRAGLHVHDFEILTRGVEDFHHLAVGHELPEGGEIQALGEGIDDRLCIGAGKLDEAQLGPEGLLAHELGVDGDIGAPRELAAKGGKPVGRSDDIHRGKTEPGLNC